LDDLIEIRDAARLTQRLRESGIPEDACTLLVQDVCGYHYRGSALRIEYGQDGVMQAERGLFLLRGQERLWLLRPSELGDGARTMLMSCTQQAFHDGVTALIAPAS
jgi:hypothetical protein